MKNLKKLIILFSIVISLNVCAEEIDNDILFQGVTAQSHDFSCGAAALSTLITGLIEDGHVSETDVIDTIAEAKGKKEEGYTASELAEASKKLGHEAEWRQVTPQFLIKLKQPVLLLSGLNSEFPHYVVLKGIENGEAFLADPIRGNVRLSYEQLTKEGISDKYKKWFVMAIEPSANKPKNSTLYLSTNKYSTHFTVEQSSAITLATVSKKNQVIVNYDFLTSLGSAQLGVLNTTSRSFSHGLGVRYGVTANAEIGGNVSYSDDRQKIKFEDNSFVLNGESRAYEIYANNRFSLDESNGIILGGRASFAEYASTWGGGVNLTGYTNTSIAQFIVGGSVNKQFSSNNAVDDSLPEVQVSGFVSANKPIGDRYLGSVSFSVSDGFSKNSSENEFNKSYTISTGLSYVISQSFQVTPMFNYSFGNGETFSFGASLAYVGGW